MARRPRIKVPGHAAAYHVVSRTSQQGYLLDNTMKDIFIEKLIDMKSLFFCHPVSFCVLDSHFHIMISMDDPEDVDADEAMKRWNSYHEKDYRLNPHVEEYRTYVVNALTDISRFMKKLNLLMTRAYNRHTGKVGSLWQSRFHSTIFERGVSVVRGSAYIELNSFRASMVKRPEDYEYSSLNYLKRGNRGGLIDIEYLEEGLFLRGLPKELTDAGAFTRELYKTYLAYVYEAGSSPKGGKGHGIVITDAMKARLKKYGIEWEQGSLQKRRWEYSKSIFVGGSECAKRFYDKHINPGYTGSEREEHIQKWLHTSGEKLWSIFSIFHRKETAYPTPPP